MTHCFLQAEPLAALTFRHSDSCMTFVLCWSFVSDLKETSQTSSELFCICAAPGPPASLSFESPTEKSLILYWTAPREINGILQGYTVQYQGRPLRNVIHSDFSLCWSSSSCCLCLVLLSVHSFASESLFNVTFLKLFVVSCVCSWHLPAFGPQRWRAKTAL